MNFSGHLDETIGSIPQFDPIEARPLFAAAHNDGAADARPYGTYRTDF